MKLQLAFIILCLSFVSCKGGSSDKVGSAGNDDSPELGFQLSASVNQTVPVVSKLQFEIYKIAFLGSFNGEPNEVINLDADPIAADFVSNPSLASSTNLISGFSSFALEVSRAITFVPINPPAGPGSCQHGVESIHYLGFPGSDAEMASAIASANTIEFNRGNDWRSWWETILVEDPNTVLGPNSDRLSIYFRNHDPYSITRWDRSLDLARSNFGMSSMNLHSSLNRGFPKGDVFNGPNQSRGKIIFTFLDPDNAVDNSVPGECLLRNFMISLEAE